MNDRLDFSIEGVKRAVENMRTGNATNEKNKQAFLEYIDGELAPEWNTVQGQQAINELKSFVNTKFQDYIDYLNGKIDAIEYEVIPALENINNA